MRNIAALTKLRDALVADKRKHDQATWGKIKLKGKFMPEGVQRMEIDCATSACAAGHACLLAGDIFIIGPDDLSYDDKDRPFYQPDTVRTRAGDEEDLQSRATSLLGLTRDERNELFYGYNSHKETIKLLDRLIAGEKIVDEY